MVRPARSSEWAEEALDLFGALGNAYGQALAQCALASALQSRGHLERAARLLETCSARFRAEGRNADVARAAYALAFVATQCGDYDGAERAARRALSGWETVGSPCGRAKALWLLASTARYRGELSVATALSEESLRSFADISDALSVVHVRLTMADVARLGGDSERAADLYDQALPELQRIGDRRCTASTLRTSCRSQVVRANWSGLRSCTPRALPCGATSATKAVWPSAWKAWPAPAAPRGGRKKRSPCLAPPTPSGARSAWRLCPERTEAAAHLDALRAELDAESFTRAWEAGLKLRTDEAVERSLQVGTSLRPS